MLLLTVVSAHDIAGPEDRAVRISHKSIRAGAEVLPDRPDDSPILSFAMDMPSFS
jgi:hypothetical protein